MTTKLRDARKLLTGLAGAALLLLAAPPGIGQTSSIQGTKHDFSTQNWGSAQICIFCHTPHNAATNAFAPLWNHAMTSATYTLYSSAVSSTFNASTSQPEGVSKLCLSCHDGTVAIDSFGTRTGTILMPTTSSTPGLTNPRLGTDLTNDHPIGFTYDSALVTADGNGNPFGAQLVVPASASKVVDGVPLFNQKVECASCHNAHNNANGAFLRVSNAGSALCLKCHRK